MILTPEERFELLLKDDSGVRFLRNQVLCDEITDVGWRQIGENWKRPDSVKWLIEKSNIPIHG